MQSARGNPALSVIRCLGFKVILELSFNKIWNGTTVSLNTKFSDSHQWNLIFFPSDLSSFSFASNLHTTTPEPASWRRRCRHFDLWNLKTKCYCAVEEGRDSAATKWQIQDASGWICGWADNSQPERSWCWGIHVWHRGPANHRSCAGERWGFAWGRDEQGLVPWQGHVIE